MKTKLILASLFVTLIALKSYAGVTGLVTVDGSSTVFPITEAVAEEFQIANRGAKVTVGISGTGGGFKKFCRGEIDISDASRPIKAEEMQICKDAGIQYVELPVAYDALTIVVNPKNPLSSIKVEELKKMWQPEAQGVVTKWNQINPSWPNQNLKLYGAGSDSGTFEYFTEATVGKAKSSRGDYTASEDDNVVVQGVATDVNGLGYFGYAYYAENQGKLKALAIDNGKGPVAPSKETVENGTYTPLSRPIFIYVNKKSLEKPQVKAFAQFYLAQAASLVAQVKYVPLPAGTYQLVAERLNKQVLGTSFADVHAGSGLKVEQVLAKSPKL